MTGERRVNSQFMPERREWFGFNSDHVLCSLVPAYTLHARFFAATLCQNLLRDLTGYIGQAKISAGVAIRQLLVIQAQ